MFLIITKQNFVIMYYLWYHIKNQIVMREYTKKPENQSRTLDNNPKASKQAPIDVILQRYKERNIQQYVKDEELIQGKFESAPASEQEVIQQEEKPNNTGLPDNLKTGIENLSGYSMDDVRVHYNSSKPAQLQAFAYAQGSDIHIAPGQEQHLPHEAWHVVQQKQGRVQPTMQLQGVNVNDNEGLEREADVMGEQVIRPITQFKYPLGLKNEKTVGSQMIQRQDRNATVVWGITHEVIPDAKGSLFGEDSNPFENEGIELHKDDKIVIDDEIIFQSRRGANQEIETRRNGDREGHLTNKWLNLKEVNGNKLSGKGYVREETIKIIKDEEKKHHEITISSVETDTAKKAADSIYSAWGESRQKRRMSLGAWTKWETERNVKNKETSPSWDQIEEGFDVSSQLSHSASEEYDNYDTEGTSDQAIFTAYDGKNPIGIIIIEKRATTNFPLFKDDNDKKWYLRWLVGHPTLKGAGGMLFAEALKHVQDNNGTGIWVESSPSAVGWYKSKGFALLNEESQKDYNDDFEQGWDSLLMYKEI